MLPLHPGTKEAGVWVHATDRTDVTWFSSLWTCHTRDNKVGYYLAVMRSIELQMKVHTKVHNQGEGPF